MENFVFKMFLMLISILGCDINSRTIFVFPLNAAYVNALSLNIKFKFH